MAIGVTCAEKFGEDRTCSSEDMIVDRQTHTQTDRHAHHNASLPYRGRSNNHRHPVIIADRNILRLVVSVRTFVSVPHFESTDI